MTCFSSPQAWQTPPWPSPPRQHQARPSSSNTCSEKIICCIRLSRPTAWRDSSSQHQHDGRGLAGQMSPAGKRFHLWKQIRHADLSQCGGRHRLSERNQKQRRQERWGENRLGGFQNQFFSAVMIAKNDFKEKNSLMTSVPQQKGSGYLKQYQAKMKTFFDPTGKTPSEFDFYYGPNDFRLLQHVQNESKFGKDLEMQRLVYLGWPLFRIINRWFTLYVFDWLTGLNINMGIVLILITLLLKVITYPLVKKSYMSSAKMRVLKPKLMPPRHNSTSPKTPCRSNRRWWRNTPNTGWVRSQVVLPMLIQMPIWIAWCSTSCRMPYSFVARVSFGSRTSPPTTRSSNGAKHLAHRRPPVTHLYPLLRRQRALFCDDDAPAERPDGGPAGRTDEDDAMDDVSHASDVLLHVQRLQCRTELLL